MSEWTIIHNPRWGTSRKALQLLRDNSIEPNIVNYIKDPLDNKYIEQISVKLGLHPNQFMRKKEQAFKDHKIDEYLDDEKKLINFMANFPKLIERPIIIRNEKAVIGRPIAVSYTHLTLPTNAHV